MRQFFHVKASRIIARNLASLNEHFHVKIEKKITGPGMRKFSLEVVQGTPPVPHEIGRGILFIRMPDWIHDPQVCFQ